MVYVNSIKHFNNLFSQNVDFKQINIDSHIVEKGLTTLILGIGDLTWPSNCGNMILPDISDNYYYSNDIIQLYYKYKIQNINVFNMRFYDYNDNDKTTDLIDSIFVWDTVSNYIIKTNCDTVNID